MKTLVCFLLLVSSAMAQTTIDLNVASGGTKTLTKAMGVIRPLRVASTVYGKLILEAGVVIEMPKDGKIDFFNGGAFFDCRGTATEPVTLRSQGADPWGQIKFIGTSKRPQFVATYTDFVNCRGWTRPIGIDALNCSIALDHVTISMPRLDARLVPTIGINMGPATFNASGVFLDTFGVISNCTITGASTGVFQAGDNVEIIDMETFGVKDPYIFQPSATSEKPYHRFSVSR